MPLGLGIGEFIEAIRDRVVVSERDETWYVSAGSFESALTYAQNRFGDPVVLSRRDRARWWPRVTLEVSMDPGRAAAAAPVEVLTRPTGNEHRAPVEDELSEERLAAASIKDAQDEGRLPASLEAIFANQAVLRH
ncbi:hypothetical protein FXB39_05090 [Nocardioides sp. BGMRC 2183]|nr:hypothetical protein FXB39_05090 [Nocardioides sp. BGMRC 2183]